MIAVVAFCGFRLETAGGELVGPTTTQDGFNHAILGALRNLPTELENDSLGYVWESRDEAERALRYAWHRLGRASS